MKQTFHIGCSGYFYPKWKGTFYPKELKPKDWLSFYNSVFNTVELNGTFYRMPKPSDLKRYASVTTKDFTFSVKVSKYITHNLKLKDTKKSITEFQDLVFDGLETKLSNFLFQLPPSFHYNEENLSRVIKNIPHKPHNVVEFRHISWWNEEAQAALKKAKLTFCNVDYPGIDSHFIHTSTRFYMRFHGNPFLFRSSYSLAKIKDYHKQLPANAKSNYIYFNNTDGGAAIENAQQFMNLVKN
jgi:uncharacterized protein YecE (DUF72 family)